MDVVVVVVVVVVVNSYRLDIKDHAPNGNDLQHRPVFAKSACQLHHTVTLFIVFFNAM